MGKYDYPSEELRSRDYAAYLAQKNIAQEYNSKMAEFERMVKAHAEQSKAHKEKSKWYLNQIKLLKKENE